MSDPGAHAGPSVGAIVVARNDAGRVLMVWQTTGPFAGHWLLPGGAIERDEPVVAGMRRELREETGLEIADERLVAVYQVMSEPAGTFDIVLFMYAGEVRGEPRAEAGSEVRWIRPDEITLHPALRRQLHDAGVRLDDVASIDADLARAGARMLRLA